MYILNSAGSLGNGLDYYSSYKLFMFLGIIFISVIHFSLQ